MSLCCSECIIWERLTMKINSPKVSLLKFWKMFVNSSFHMAVQLFSHFSPSLVDVFTDLNRFGKKKIFRTLILFGRVWALDMPSVRIACVRHSKSHCSTSNAEESIQIKIPARRSSEKLIDTLKLGHILGDRKVLLFSVVCSK